MNREPVFQAFGNAKPEQVVDRRDGHGQVFGRADDLLRVLDLGLARTVDLERHQQDGSDTVGRPQHPRAIRRSFDRLALST